MITVKSFDRGHLQDGVDLFMDTFARPPWNDKYESRQQVVDFFENYLGDSYFMGYALEQDGALVGLCIGAKKPYIKGMEYYIDQLCIAHACQGQGLGGKFMAAIEADTKKKGLKAIILNTERGTPAEGFYLKNGFEVLEEVLFLAK